MQLGQSRTLPVEKPDLIDLAQAARYFGARGEADTATMALLQRCAVPLLAAVLVWALHAKLKVLFFLCLVMSLVTFWTYQAGRMGYRKSWTQFREGNRPDGTVTFTASGIREWNASDHTERFTWEQWDCCIISREVIVLTFHQPMLVLLPYTQESESTVVQALNAFGKQDTIYKV